MNGGARAITIDEVPLEWCLQPAVKLDFRHLPHGYVATAADVEAELKRIGHDLAPLEIVVVNTSAGQRYGHNDYVSSGCGMGREATLHLLERGVRVTGTDAWSWDAPFVHTAKRYALDHDPSIIWEGHRAGREIGYCHIEKLHGLEQLPDAGFQVSCFPVKIHAASAGWTRAVAISTPDPPSTRTSMSVAITVAPTGPIASKQDNPHLPTQPEEITDAVVLAYNAGASVAHIHLRDTEHRPTADLDIARRTMDLITERCPILIQLSTGVGLSVPFEERGALVELLPRMATLNPCSMSFGAGEFRNPPADVRRLAAHMRELGVKPKLEIYDTGHLDACLRLRDEGLLDDEPMQFSIVLGVAGGMAATPDNLLTLVRRLPREAVWQVIAIGRRNLELTAIGLALGGNARAGLEDALYLRKGELSPGNLPLVERTVALARDLDLAIAGVDEAASLLGIDRSACVTAEIDQMGTLTNQIV